MKNIFDPAPVQTQRSEGSPRSGDTILRTKEDVDRGDVDLKVTDEQNQRQS